MVRGPASRRGPAGEELEAALGVSERQAADLADEEVHGPAGALSPPGLAHDEPGLLQPARADDDVEALLQEREEALELLDGGGEVRIREEDPLPPRVPAAVCDGKSLAPVLFVAEDADSRVRHGHRFGVGGGTVFAAVIHDEDLAAERQASQVLTDAVQRCGEAPLLVVAGNDEAQLGMSQ